jgi:hypothetical protein
MFAKIMDKLLKEALDLRRGIKVVDFSRIHGNTLVRRVSDGRIGMYHRCTFGKIEKYPESIHLPTVYFEHDTWPQIVDPADLVLARLELQLQAPTTIIKIHEE